jgi:hypothetical protein
MAPASGRTGLDDLGSVPAEPTSTGSAPSERAVHAAAMGLRAWLPVQTKNMRKGATATPGTYPARLVAE